jgi:hypothetical protein
MGLGISIHEKDILVISYPISSNIGFLQKKIHSPGFHEYCKIGAKILIFWGLLVGKDRS